MMGTVIGTIGLLLAATSPDIVAPPPPAAAAGPLWLLTSGTDKDGATFHMIVRQTGNWNIQYGTTGTFAPNLHFKLKGDCGGGDWNLDATVFSGGSVAERAAFVLDDARDRLAEATARCALPSGATDHLMDGFAEAFAGLAPLITDPDGD